MKQGPSLTQGGAPAALLTQSCQGKGRGVPSVNSLPGSSGRRWELGGEEVRGHTTSEYGRNERNGENVVRGRKGVNNKGKKMMGDCEQRENN